MSDQIGQLGSELAAALTLWNAELNARRRDAGFPFLTEARGGLLAQIAPTGTPQVKLVERAGMTKQAVQQHLDQLEIDGAIVRIADKKDSRRRVIRLTDTGRAARDADLTCREQAEATLLSYLGEKKARNFRRLLRILLKAEPDQG